MNTTKKTAFGILGAAASAVLLAGVATPAMADDHDSSTTSTWSEYVTTLTGAVTGGDLGLHNESPVVIAPEILNGGIANGSTIGSGILSGNEVGNGNVVGSGNDTSVGSGNTLGIDGVDVDASDLFDSTVGDITGNVSDLLDDLDASLDTMFED